MKTHPFCVHIHAIIQYYTIFRRYENLKQKIKNLVETKKFVLSSIFQCLKINY